MSASSGVFKRRSCLNDVGRPFNSRCPRLPERGHGSWYFRVELPAGRSGRRRQLRRGGFSSRGSAKQARDYLRNPTVGNLSRALVGTAQWLQLWLDTRLGPGELTMQKYREQPGQPRSLNPARRHPLLPIRKGRESARFNPAERFRSSSFTVFRQAEHWKSPSRAQRRSGTTGHDPQRKKPPLVSEGTRHLWAARGSNPGPRD
jgi:hypothetical protein